MQDGILWLSSILESEAFQFKFKFKRKHARLARAYLGEDAVPSAQNH